MTRTLAFAAFFGLCFMPSLSFAADNLVAVERFQIRLRGIGVLPDDNSSVNIGGQTDVGDALVPEIDLSYFITDKIALELIAATAQHSITYNGGTHLGNTWILPPTLTAQYHFMPENTFSPYLGAGINYSWFYGEDSGQGFSELEIDGGFGVALQAGTDIWMNENWGINLDVKKIYLGIDASLLSGVTPVSADIDLDPWIVGGGVSYRF